MMIRILFTILVLSATATQIVAQESASTASAEGPKDLVRFTVSGIANDKGTLRCGLFPEDSWLGKSVLSANAAIEDGRAVCEFQDVPAGTYGISSYHDKNDNGKMDLGFMRIPKEDYAASNNARGSFGPPKFEDARFDYESGLLELEAEIK